MHIGSTELIRWQQIFALGLTFKTYLERLSYLEPLILDSLEAKNEIGEFVFLFGATYLPAKRGLLKGEKKKKKINVLHQSQIMCLPAGLKFVRTASWHTWNEGLVRGGDETDVKWCWRSVRRDGSPSREGMNWLVSISACMWSWLAKPLLNSSSNSSCKNGSYNRRLKSEARRRQSVRQSSQHGGPVVARG